MKRSNKGPEMTAPADWLINGGDMGRLIRSMDWSATPLGPRAHWPCPLRAITNVALSSTLAMAILWGKELIFIYNDGYRDILADKHPCAMGRSTCEIWPEVWEFNRPIFEKVMQKGQAVHLEDQLFRIKRRDEMKDAFFTLSYSPIWLDHGHVGGAVVTLIETTERIHAEKQLRSLSAHLQDTIEKERLSIAREVHDDFGQSLSALKMDINWIKKRLYSDQTTVAEKLEVMASEINRSIQSVKRICTELRPAILEDLGLVYVIEWHTARFQERTGIRCCLDMKMTDVKGDSHITTALYRIHQEALTNVGRHAQATKVEVSLTHKKNRIILEIKDNGRGIRNSDLSGSKSFGIIGMRERVYALGGDFDISGEPGRGTRIRVSVPLKRR